jgi:hypothetical protein
MDFRRSLVSGGVVDGIGTACEHAPQVTPNEHPRRNGPSAICSLEAAPSCQPTRLPLASPPDARPQGRAPKARYGHQIAETAVKRAMAAFELQAWQRRRVFVRCEAQACTQLQCTSASRCETDALCRRIRQHQSRRRSQEGGILRAIGMQAEPSVRSLVAPSCGLALVQ